MLLKAYPKNKAQVKKLILFCNEILDICKDLGITPILYGSLAYFLYTKDRHVRVKDIDILVPKDSIKNIDKALTAKKIRHRLVKREGIIKAFKKGSRIEIDGIFPTSEINLSDSKYTKLGRSRIRVVSFKNLKKIYGQAVKESKQKAKEYERKYLALRKINL